MSNQVEATSADLSRKTEVPMDASTRLSYERTMLSHDRTLMSWVRTATSLITFGFTIYKFFQIELGGLASTSNSPGHRAARVRNGHDCHWTGAHSSSQRYRTGNIGKS